ncbi:hypothetical protein KC19_2G206000 [Ceratodon purpureus]|uniref:Uncharacterized protein n=1 Tax=Ceratodon purpureus TaxID=3225 RepID=A0A8T0IYA4_CERPU|nr:hypothetical protein KC19_2G206000 [Ceratodon purpureus]
MPGYRQVMNDIMIRILVWMCVRSSAGYSVRLGLGYGRVWRRLLGPVRRISVGQFQGSMALFTVYLCESSNICCRSMWMTLFMRFDKQEDVHECAEVYFPRD